MNIYLAYITLIISGMGGGIFSYWSLLYSLRNKNFISYALLSFCKISAMSYFLYLMLKTNQIPSILVISLGLSSYIGTLLFCKEKIRG